MRLPAGRTIAVIRMFLLVATTYSPAADGKSPDPDSAGDPSAVAESQSAPDRLWHFTSYLKGTTSQVRQQLNGEVERLLAKKKEAEQAVSEYKASVKSDEKAVTERVHKDPRYLQLEIDLQKADADLKRARKEGTPQEKLDDSARWNRVRESIGQLENDALANDRALKDDRDLLMEQIVAVKHHEEALGKAEKWRLTLVEAIRTSARLKWPLDVGSTGVLGNVTPLQVIDGHTLLIGYDAFEIVGKSGQTEEIENVDVVPHRVKMLVTGIDTGAFREKEPVVLDKTFVVVQTADDDLRYKVKKTPTSDIDRFFETVIPIRSIPPG